LNSPPSIITPKKQEKIKEKRERGGRTSGFLSTPPYEEKREKKKGER